MTKPNKREMLSFLLGIAVTFLTLQICADSFSASTILVIILLGSAVVSLITSIFFGFIILLVIGAIIKFLASETWKKFKKWAEGRKHV